MSNWLSIVAKHHKYYISVVHSFGEYNYAEDIVQEMYLRIHKYTSEEKIIKDGEVNQGFIWFVLRNIYVDFCKQKSKVDKVDLKEAILISDVSELEVLNAKQRLEEKIEKEIKSWHWYDEKLFRLYKDSGKSMREIESGTTISLTSIFNTIKNCKNRIKVAVGEDYEDLKNNDFELI
jgi:DNA-directed RNA polymerase specialized sigma24 family protein